MAVPELRKCVIPVLKLCSGLICIQTGMDPCPCTEKELDCLNRILAGVYIYNRPDTKVKQIFINFMRALLKKAVFFLIPSSRRRASACRDATAAWPRGRVAVTAAAAQERSRSAAAAAAQGRVVAVAAAHRHARASSPHGRAGEQPLLPTRRRAAAAARDEQQRANELTRAPCVGRNLRHRRRARARALRGRAPWARPQRARHPRLLLRARELQRLVADLAVLCWFDPPQLVEITAMLNLKQDQ